MSIDLTGDWAGFYCQAGEECPIHARLIQRGERLTGTMRDGQPDTEFSLFDFAVRAGLPPGADEQIEARLREAIPDAPAGPIRFITHLPPDSALDGRVEGRTVAFRKTYLGAHFGGYRLGDKLIGFKTEEHHVDYEGRLSPDGTSIEGRWWIDHEHGSPRQRTVGEFELRRVASESTTGTDDPKPMKQG